MNPVYLAPFVQSVGLRLLGLASCQSATRSIAPSTALGAMASDKGGSDGVWIAAISSPREGTSWIKHAAKANRALR